MIRKSELPQIDGITPPPVPTPWESSKQYELFDDPEDGLTWKVLRANPGDTTRQQVADYRDWAITHYPLPGHVARVVRDVFTDNPVSAPFYTEDTTGRYATMMQRFEQDHLELPPNDSNDGVRWWESGTGFSGAQYPTETIAATVGLGAQELREYIEHHKRPLGHISLVSEAYLIPVSNSRLSEEIVNVSGVHEFSPLGTATLRIVLDAYEAGLNQPPR